MTMKASVSLLCFFLLIGTALAQQSPSDSLKKLLSQPMPDTARVLLLDQLSYTLMYSKPLVAMQYAQEGWELAKKSKFPKGQVRNMNRLGSILRFTSNYGKALEMHFASLQLAESIHDQEGVARTLNNIGILYLEQKDLKKAIEYFRKTQIIAQQIPDLNLAQIAMVNIATNYAFLNQLDSARRYIQMAYQLNNKNKNTLNTLLISMGNIYYRTNEFSTSLKYYRLSLPYLKSIENNRLLSQTYFEMAQVFGGMNRLDSCLYYAQQALKLSQASNNVKYTFEAGSLLASLYDATNKDLAYDYFKLASAAKDSMFNQEKVKQVQNMSFNEQLRQQELIATQEAYENRQKIGVLLGIVGMFLLISFILYRNNRQKQKANTLLQRQKEEINRQREKAEKALIELKTTQTQLIHKEKMASLGELTAGIAHEIQNPLNFVNNFSEVSSELADEIEDELKAGNLDVSMEIVGDLKQSLSKINYHGKRASNIVKGMLEHSKTVAGERMLTNLNRLADDYLKIAYHGMKAKDNAFEAEIITYFDETLPKIEVIPQEIGRVLLNLINNAFQSPAPPEGGTNYRKKVVVKTFKTEANNDSPFGTGGAPLRRRAGWGLAVTDNGAGIPADILPKIFQPFFTTKPAGEGTGLGLSLSFDIITKGHGGTIEVESEEGKGATFRITLPIV